MPNVFSLNGLTGIVRYDLAESLVSAMPDAKDAKAAAVQKLADTRAKLTVEESVIQAIDIRITRLPPAMVQPVSLQDLLRNARRRLASERQRDARGWLKLRVDAVDRLEQALET